MTATFKEVKRLLACANVSIKKNEFDEFVVNLPCGREATAYYTNDLNDAYLTGLNMSSRVKEGEEVFTNILIAA